MPPDPPQEAADQQSQGTPSAQGSPPKEAPAPSSVPTPEPVSRESLGQATESGALARDGLELFWPVSCPEDPLTPSQPPPPGQMDAGVAYEETEAQGPQG